MIFLKNNRSLIIQFTIYSVKANNMFYSHALISTDLIKMLGVPIFP